MTNEGDATVLTIPEAPVEPEQQPLPAVDPLAPVMGLPLNRLTIIQKIYLWLAFLWNIVPFVMYSAFPGYTVWLLGGKRSPTATFFCWLNSSGDAAIIYLTAAALVDNGKNPIVFRITARCCVLFAFFHFSGYWYWSTLPGADPETAWFWLFYPIALLVNIAALVAWGWQ